MSFESWGVPISLVVTGISLSPAYVLGTVTANTSKWFFPQPGVTSFHAHISIHLHTQGVSWPDFWNTPFVLLSSLWYSVRQTLVSSVYPHSFILHRDSTRFLLVLSPLAWKVFGKSQDSLSSLYLFLFDRYLHTLLSDVQYLENHCFIYFALWGRELFQEGGETMFYIFCLLYFVLYIKQTIVLCILPYYFILTENGNISSYISSHIWNDWFLKINLAINIREFFTGQSMHSCVGSPDLVMYCPVVSLTSCLQNFSNYLPLFSA